MKQHIAAFALSVVIVLSIFSFCAPSVTVQAVNDTSSEKQDTLQSDDAYFNYYSNYYDGTFASEKFSLSSENVVRFDDFAKATDTVEGKKAVIFGDDNGWCEWEFDIPSEGNYSISIEYYALPMNGKDILLSLELDGKIPYTEAASFQLQRLWQDVADGSFERDEQGNDIQPEQKEVFCWQNKYFNNVEGLYSEPYFLHLSEGHHTVRLSVTRESIAVAALILGGVEELPSYSEYISKYSSVTDKGQESVIQQAEMTYTKSSAALYPTYDRSVSSPGFKYIEKAINATCCVTLTEQSNRIDFHTDVAWNNYNHRLRVAFPAAFSGAGVYGIPYGMIERKEYEPKYTRVPGINGDYPAQNWGGIQGEEISMAVLNRGTPSYYTEADLEQDKTNLFVTVLRSPGVPSELHEPHNYTMTDWDGMRDAGNHSFDYSLCVYDKNFSENSIVADSVNYGSSPITAYGELDLPSLPNVCSENAAVMSVKAAEDGKALIMRINEYRGKDGTVKITLPDWVDYADQVNMLERKGKKLPVEDNSVSLSVHPYEITTLKFYR